MSCFDDLDADGLNLHAVFDLAALPADVLDSLGVDDLAPYRQLLLVGHLGTTLWQRLQQAGMEGPDPIDRYSRTCVDAWLQHHLPGVRHAVLYPGSGTPALQRLGQLVGWHHPSPFMVGISAQWGSWFAYRAVVLMDTGLPPSPARTQPSPCESCALRPCVAACPAAALDAGFALERCLQYRLEAHSQCREQCLARNRCPQGEPYRYGAEQIAYHYRQSLDAIVRWRQGA
ncbi:MAG: hypothetical protein ACT4NV_05825 [Rhodoferax sp.]